MIILIIHIIVSYDKNISLIFYVKDGSYVRLWHPSCVYITAQRQYTAVQKMCTPPKKLSLHYNLGFTKVSSRNLIHCLQKKCTAVTKRNINKLEFVYIPPRNGSKLYCKQRYGGYWYIRFISRVKEKRKASIHCDPKIENPYTKSFFKFFN